jgi:hypothetical protein
MKLRRYWFKFGNLAKFHPLSLGCGVTAFDYDDALRVLRENVFRCESLPPIEMFVEDIDISTLDPGHVWPNIEVPIYRGVWFPKGYHEPIR